MKPRVFGAILTFVVGTLVLAAPAFASSRHDPASSRIMAQATPCSIGEVCDVSSSDTGQINDAKLPKPKDPSGAFVRSLLVMALMFAAFLYYLWWALKRGTVY